MLIKLLPYISYAHENSNKLCLKKLELQGKNEQILTYMILNRQFEHLVIGEGRIIV